MPGLSALVGHCFHLLRGYHCTLRQLGTLRFVTFDELRPERTWPSAAASAELVGSHLRSGSPGPERNTAWRNAARDDLGIPRVPFSSPPLIKGLPDRRRPRAIFSDFLSRVRRRRQAVLPERVICSTHTVLGSAPGCALGRRAGVGAARRPPGLRHRPASTHPRDQRAASSAAATAGTAATAKVLRCGTTRSDSPATLSASSQWDAAPRSTNGPGALDPGRPGDTTAGTDQCPGHTMVTGALTLTAWARTPQYDDPCRQRPSRTRP